MKVLEMVVLLLFSDYLSYCVVEVSVIGGVVVVEKVCEVNEVIVCLVCL